MRPIDAERGGKGERFTAQTPEEAARLAEYNRYLAALGAEDADAGLGGGTVSDLFAFSGDRAVHGAVLRYRVMAFIVGTALWC